jgi:hypothetical protein
MAVWEGVIPDIPPRALAGVPGGNGGAGGAKPCELAARGLPDGPGRGNRGRAPIEAVVAACGLPHLRCVTARIPLRMPETVPSGAERYELYLELGEQRLR